MSEQFPPELRYHPEHTWIGIAADTVHGTKGFRVGITWTAQDALGDIVFVEPPAPGTGVTAGEPCGELESTKTTSDIIAPATGTVLEVNSGLVSTPELLNSDPYVEGWIFTVQVSGEGEPDGLLDSVQYAAVSGT